MSQERTFRLVVFEIAGQRYGLPLGAVERILPTVAITPLPKGPAVALGVINVQGVVVPVVDLRRRFGLPSVESALDAHLLLARTARRTLALSVDEAVGVTEVTTRAVIPPHAVLPGIEQVAGLVALPEGLLFIYDLEALLSLDEERQLAEALKETDT